MKIKHLIEKLFNVRPNKQVITALKGEVIMPAQVIEEKYNSK